MWQEAIKSGSYDSQCDGLTWGGGKTPADATPFESRLASAAVSRDPSRPASPNHLGTSLNGCDSSTTNNKRDSGASDVSAELRKSRKNLKKIRDLASAILQVAQVLQNQAFYHF